MLTNLVHRSNGSDKIHLGRGRTLHDRGRVARTDCRIGSRRRSGAAALEMAMILPLFLLLVLGAADLGRFAATAIAVDASARAGAGYGIVNPYTSVSQATWTTNMNLAVTNEMQSMYDSHFGASNVAASFVKTNDAGNAWRIRVTVSFPFRTVITWPGIPHQTTITQSVEMRGIR